MGAAGRLGVLLLFWCFCCFLLKFFDDGVGWGGVGWDVNVHVTFMMLRWSWGSVGWGGMLTFMWRCMMLRWSMLMVLVHGPKLRKFWKFLLFKRIISIKNMLPQFVRCPKDCPRSVEHRPLIQIGNRWSAGFPRKLPKKEALLTWWPTPQNWSKGSGNGCGAEPNCAAVIQRNLQPWANCSMVEVVFRTSKNRRATLHRQFQWEIHAHALKTTRRLSAPFPS